MSDPIKGRQQEEDQQEEQKSGDDIANAVGNFGGACLATIIVTDENATDGSSRLPLQTLDGIIDDFKNPKKSLGCHSEWP